MDAARFGRALGLGTREVAKALVRAADAAASPSPTAKPAADAVEAVRTQPAPAVRPEPATRSQPLAAAAPKQQAARRPGGNRVFTAGREAGRKAWAPMSRAAGVLWFEITGVFFGIFAAGMGFEAWHRRADLAGRGDARTHALTTVFLLALFTWFTVSSFLRARRRGKR